MNLQVKPSGRCVAIVLALSLAGLAGCVPVTTRQGAVQGQRLDQLAEELQRLKREVHEASTPAPSSVSDDKLAERLAELGAHVERIDQDTKSFGGKLEELDYALKNQAPTGPDASVPGPEVQKLGAGLKELALRVDTLAKRLDAIELSGVGAAAAPAAPQANTAPPESTQKPLSPKELYDKAYKLYRQGEYAKSNTAFRQYLQHFPDTALTDNAYFWIGEIYYDQRQYEQAILQYDQVVQKFPKGDKVASAILKQAFAFSAIGDNLDARILLKKVIKEHPESEQAGIAKKKLAVIGD